MDVAPTARVSAVRCPTYDLEMVRAALRDVLTPLGGMRAFVSTGDRVLIKPNFLIASKVHKAVCTHPAVVLAVAEAALDAGAGAVTVGDSPAVGSGRSVARKLGLLEPLTELGVEVIDLKDPVVADAVDPDVFRRFEIARRVLDADRVINLAKLKTHGQMSMTMALKNTFGVVVGTRKGAWHMEAGRDAQLFARMLVELHRRVAPALNLVDAIVGMEGNGPNAGTPRDIGLLVASPEAALVDQYLSEVVQFPPEALPVLAVAWEATGGPASFATPLLAGPPPGAVAVDDFAMSRPQHISMEQGPLRRLIRRVVEVRPKVLSKACVGCGRCAKVCPADAIEMLEKDPNPLPRIDRTRCIHCFICQETCPEGAIVVGRGMVRSLLR
jgi:uncharacterized protein (DUF362 family)/Pyruvate/2-oxoacid:ferredoxin oxidoreductase delta subunit